MSTKEERLRLAALLDGVADGRVDPDEAIQQISDPTWHDMPWKEKAFSTAWHCLHHFQSDVDIRERDPEYAIAQRQYLQSVAVYLRADNYDPKKHVPGSGNTISVGSIRQILVVAILILVVIVVWFLL